MSSLASQKVMRDSQEQTMKEYDESDGLWWEKRARGSTIRGLEGWRYLTTRQRAGDDR